MPENTQLQRYEQQMQFPAVGGQHDINGAMQSLGSSMSYYQIQQKDKDGAHPGCIIALDSERQYVDFVWIATSYSRVMFPPITSGMKGVLCKSADGKMPSDGMRKMPGPCISCPKSQWDRSMVPAKAPDCSETWSMLCWDLQEDLPFIFNIKRTGIKPLQQLATKLKFGRGKYAYEGLSPFCCVKIRLTGAPIEMQTGKRYFMPKFAILGRLEKEQAIIYSQISGAGTVGAVNRETGAEFETGAEMPLSQEEPKQQAYPQEPPPPPQKTIQKIAVPDYTVFDWELCKVGFQKTGNLTWKDLAMGATLPDGRNGKAFLHALTGWKEHPEVAEVAHAALELFNHKPQDGEDVTFTPRNEEPPF